ncbi:MAG: hypothetical protein J6W64_10890 [Bacilli bacterium]|nr:hypothetical protein [Bacilli bacterium]
MELYHSDKYLGADYSDELKHYKYIKREMKNGRWVYYYNTTPLANEKEGLKKNIKTDKYMLKYQLRDITPQGDGRLYGPSYYKRALRQDRIDLAKTNAKMKSIKIATKSLNEISKYRDIGKKKINKIFDKLKNKRR